ncbi:IS1380 family transposase [bacterium]|nr:IS1380 family transposase [bacterium]
MRRLFPPTSRTFVGFNSTTQTVLFPEIFSKPIVARLDQEDSSSDGGALLLKAADERLGLSEALAKCLRDRRQPGKVSHSQLELLRQRIFGIALGYPDANDARGLAEDPIHKLLLGRDPIDGEPLASQPSISRFENGAGRVDLLRMAETLLEVVIEQHRRRLRGRRCRRITLDFDPTDDPTHGQQEFTFFHGYYDTYCYLPLLGTMAFDDEKEQYLICAMLRPGNSAAHTGLIAVLRRVLEKLWAAFPKARIRVRLDGGFGAPPVLDFLDENGVEYMVGLSATKPLKKRARRTLGTARRLFREAGETVPVYGETLHKTKTTWPHLRRVIFKAEVVQLPGREPKDNVRFVVTNLRSSPQHVYRTYTDRGDMENRIKELKNDLGIDRTSCSRFLANQLRVLLTAAAYVLIQELRLRARHTDCAHAQVGTLRLRLFKLAAWVEVSVRRVVVHLPRSFPAGASWLRIAATLGAVPP